MNERLKALCTEAFTKAWESKIVPDGMLKTDEEPYVFYEKFAELLIKDAFRAGIVYSAEKYENTGDERFTGNDVSLFLEMESCEISDEDILSYFYSLEPQ